MRWPARGTVLVSSHNLVLAPLLAHRLDPFVIGPDGAQLALAPGVLAHTNGVALLAGHGFGQQVQQEAARVAHWLGERLAHPDGCEALLVR